MLDLGGLFGDITKLFELRWFELCWSISVVLMGLMKLGLIDLNAYLWGFASSSFLVLTAHMGLFYAWKAQIQNTIWRFEQENVELKDIDGTKVVARILDKTDVGNLTSNVKRLQDRKRMLTYGTLLLYAVLAFIFLIVLPAAPLLCGVLC